MQVTTSSQLFIWLILGAMIAWWFAFNKGVKEKFSSWQSDVLLLRGYVIDILIRTYNFLRDKYAPVLLQGPQPYIPNAHDAAMSDPSLVEVRAELVSLIDSWYHLMVAQYGEETVKNNMVNDNVTYQKNADGTLIILNTVNGKLVTYLV